MRVPIGGLILNIDQNIIDFSARLDLWNAKDTGIIKTEKGNIKWSSFVCSEPSTIIIEIENDKAIKNTFRFELEKAVGLRYTFRNTPLDHHNPEPEFEMQNEINICTQVY